MELHNAVKAMEHPYTAQVIPDTASKTQARTQIMKMAAPLLVVMRDEMINEAVKLWKP